ncbi:uncharacterized protein JCM10292_004575 [Rhodotorula paludigena]|uniref:uncharacterized protein n=1 Tax=Rhodotorula paludigena TaxID=86838 RepID=UPI0031773989
MRAALVVVAASAGLAARAAAVSGLSPAADILRRNGGGLFVRQANGTCDDNGCCVSGGNTTCSTTIPACDSLDVLLDEHYQPYTAQYMESGWPQMCRYGLPDSRECQETCNELYSVWSSDTAETRCVSSLPQLIHDCTCLEWNVLSASNRNFVGNDGGVYEWCNPAQSSPASNAMTSTVSSSTVSRANVNASSSATSAANSPAPTQADAGNGAQTILTGAHPLVVASAAMLATAAFAAPIAFL